MRRYADILAARCRLSISLAAQYRWDFLTDGAMSLLWLGVGLLPLLVAFDHRPDVRGWSYGEVLLVVGIFTMQKALFGSLLMPSLTELAERIRDGKLDFLLTKPADALFLVSTARFEFWRMSDLLWGAGLVVWALLDLSYLPSLLQLGSCFILSLFALVTLYALCVFVASLAFVVIRMEALPYVFSSLLDFGRWPVTIFRGMVRILFTVVFPVAILTTYPAAAVLGRLDWSSAGWAAFWSITLLWLARLAFSRAIRRYTSASS